MDCKIMEKGEKKILSQAMSSTNTNGVP